MPYVVLVVLAARKGQNCHAVKNMHRLNLIEVKFSKVPTLQVDVVLGDSMLNRTFFILAFSLSSFQSQAASVCNTLSDCLKLLNLVNARLQDLNPESSVISSIVFPKERGGELWLNQAEAVAHCAGKKMHLPTILELAQIYEGFGVEISNRELNSDSNKVLAINPNGKAVQFYYSAANYKRPKNELGGNWYFWSSSKAPESSESFWGVDARTGEFAQPTNLFKNVVMCLPGR